MRPGWLLVLLVPLLTFATDLGGTRLWDRDEPRNAQCAAEMLQRGDWVVPTFGGELRTHKPVLLYWCQMTTYRWLGVSEWTARLPSALAALGTVGLCFAIGRRLAAASVAAWAALVLGTSLMFVVAGRAATPDATLIFCSTLAVALAVRFALYPQDEAGDDGLRPVVFCWPRFWQWATVYAACGLAVLAKGPIGLLLPGSVIGLLAIGCQPWPARAPWPSTARPSVARPSLAWLARWLGLFGVWVWRAATTAWRMRPLTALAVVVLVAGPWYAAVGAATNGRWLREFFIEHNVGRAWQPMEGHDGPAVLYYLVALLVGMFPWSAFAIPIVLTTVRCRRQSAASGGRLHPLWLLAMSWVVVYLGFFSLSATKLPSYITPCYPGVALVSGWYFRRLATGVVDFPRWFLAGCAVAAAIGASLAAVLLSPATESLPTVRPWAAAGVLYAGAAISAAALVWRGRPRWAARCYAGGAVALIWLLLASLPTAADRGRRDLDALQATLVRFPNRTWYAVDGAEPSWVFYGGGRVVDGASGPAAEQSVAHVTATGSPAGTDLPAPSAVGWIVRQPRHQQALLADGRFQLVAQAPLFANDGSILMFIPREATSQAARRDGAALAPRVTRRMANGRR